MIDFYPWLFLLFLFNLLWFFTYALVLRRGYLDKAAGIPLFSLTLNLAWLKTSPRKLRAVASDCSNCSKHSRSISRV
jgi:hypothetical protein